MWLQCWLCREWGRGRNNVRGVDLCYPCWADVLELQFLGEHLKPAPKKSQGEDPTGPKAPLGLLDPLQGRLFE